MIDKKRKMKWKKRRKTNFVRPCLLSNKEPGKRKKGREKQREREWQRERQSERATRKVFIKFHFSP